MGGAAIGEAAWIGAFLLAFGIIIVPIVIIVIVVKLIKKKRAK